MTEQEAERIVRAAQAVLDAWKDDGDASVELINLDQALGALPLTEKIDLGIL